MTTRQPPRPADTTPDEPLLVVAVCDGHRCRALRALHDAGAPSSPDSRSLIREAVRTTQRSMMLSTTCLGPCAHAAVVAVGRAILVSSNAVWLAPPVCWGSTETARHATELAAWISTSPSHLSARSRPGVRAAGGSGRSE